MKNRLHTLLILIASSAASSGAVVSYPTLNTTLTTQGGLGADDTETVTSAISVAPNHTWIDNNSGGPPYSPDVYFGGNISFTPETNNGSEWGSGINFDLRIGGSTVITLNAGSGTNGWRFLGDSSGGTIAGYARANTFDFVIRVEDGQWNTAVAKIYLGANANNATEGTPDYTVNVSNRVSSPIDTIVFSSYTSEWTGGTATSMATLNYAFSATEWTPVSAVPEPSQYAAILGILAVALGLYRRKLLKQ